MKIEDVCILGSEAVGQGRALLPLNSSAGKYTSYRELWTRNKTIFDDFLTLALKRVLESWKPRSLM